MKNMVIASMYWDSLGELHKTQADEIMKMGYSHEFFESEELIPNDVNVILVQGPYGSIVSLVEQLMMMPCESRPVLAYWFQQSLQFIGPRYFNSNISKLFSDLYWLQMPGWYDDSRNDDRKPGCPSWLRGTRLGFMGDILWLDRNRLLDLLVLSSSVYADYLSSERIPSTVVARGYHPGYGRDLGLERDIAVLWMGKTRTHRRQKIIYGLREKLVSQGLIMHIYDGVNDDFIFGERRTELLNRSKFVLNVNSFGPVDELSIRYFIAAANGAVILREPNDNQYPFVPGKHLVECAPEQMAEVIAHFLNRPDELEKISANMRQLVTTDLTLSKSLETILERATSIFLSRRGDA